MVLLYAPVVADASRRAVGCDCLAHRFGNAADRAGRRAVYPTDLTDAQWAAIAPLIPIPAWIRGRGGRPEGYCHREMIDAVLYVDDNGTKWRALPVDFPEWAAVYRFFRRWREQGLIDVLHDRLRRACRIAAGREPEPSAAAVDSQSLRAAETVAKADRGYDAGKRVNGTKRHIAVDTLGWLLTVLVTGAGVQDRDGALPLLERLRAVCLRVALVWADGAYAGALVGWAREELALCLQIVKRPDDVSGFVVVARRWVAERTLAWITRRRRCVRDYERRHDSHEAMVRWAMVLVMTRRLAKQAPQPPARTRPGALGDPAACHQALELGTQTLDLRRGHPQPQHEREVLRAHRPRRVRERPPQLPVAGGQVRLGQIRAPHRHQRRLGSRCADILRLPADALVRREHRGERGPRDRDVLQRTLGLAELGSHPRGLLPQPFDPRAHEHLVRIEQPVHRDHDRLQQLSEPSPRHCHEPRGLTHPRPNYFPSSTAMFGKTTSSKHGIREAVGAGVG